MKKAIIYICAIIISITIYYGFYFFSLKNTLAFPEIKVNPYKRNPLCALVSFNSKEPVKVQLTVEGKNGAQDINHEFSEFSTKHEIPVLGLYPNYKNKVIIKTINSKGETKKKTLQIKTQKLTNALDIEVTQKTVKNPKYYFMTDGFVFDEDGNIRLILESKELMKYYFNNEIISENRLGGLKRYSLLGEELQTYQYPEDFTSFTHGIVQKPNGNYIVLGSCKDTNLYIKGKEIPTHDDIAIELDYNTGELVNKIDLAQLLNPIRKVNISANNPTYGLNDWCHINGVDYDTSDDSIIISCKNNGIAKIKDRTNELIWIIAPNKGFENSGRDGKGPDISNKVLIAVDENDLPFKKEIQQGACSNSMFKWPVTPHNPQIFKNNIFTVYDNSGEIDDKTIYTTEKSIASIYKIDEDKKTIKQIWFKQMDEYIPTGSSVTYDEKDNDVTVFSESICDKYLPDTHVKKIVEYDNLTRYDFNTQEILFSANILNKGCLKNLYKNIPFQFYPENNK